MSENKYNKGDSETIVGLATPAGRGGISILKLSGSDALPILETVFTPSQNGRTPARSASNPRRLMHGHIRNPRDGAVIDEVLVSVMEGPKSYTRENVVEINLHGGPVVVQTVLNLLVDSGARIAEPGEFTKRAFLNGRIDLTQAEAVIDLINAKTEGGLRAFSSMIGGALGGRLSAIQTAITDVLAEIEGAIDFDEEIEALTDGGEIAGRIDCEIVGPISAILDTYHEGRLLREGFRVAIIGRPNVGKSTLMNALLGADRAIVTPIAGTTRDLLEETLNLGGVPVVLSDTAGWHESDDPVEIIGIEKSRGAAAEADLILLLVDATDPVLPEPFSTVAGFDRQPILLVVNKMDLVAGAKVNGRSLVPSMDRVEISARYGHGLDQLAQRIRERATGGGGSSNSNSDAILVNCRQKQQLETVMASLKRAGAACGGQVQLELVAEDLRAALKGIERTLGQEISTDILDQVFSRFCIGK